MWTQVVGKVRLALLPYASVRTAEDPESSLLGFMQSTYEAAAELGRWDRTALEAGLAGHSGHFPNSPRGAAAQSAECGTCWLSMTSSLGSIPDPPTCMLGGADGKTLFQMKAERRGVERMGEMFQSKMAGPAGVCNGYTNRFDLDSLFPLRIPAKAIGHSEVFDHNTVGGRISGRREACFRPDDHLLVVGVSSVR